MKQFQQSIIDKNYLIFLLIITLVIPCLISADSGMLVMGPREIAIEQSRQNAIIAWNGHEEVIILSTEVKSSESTLVLQIIPLPSNPTKIEEDSLASFRALIDIFNKKVRAIRAFSFTLAGSVDDRGVEIVRQKTIGAHDITVVKVNNLDYFTNWVEEFVTSKGFRSFEISPQFRNAIANYLGKNINFFVFNIIESEKEKKIIKPLIYRFQTNYLFYPFEITANSDIGSSRSGINLFIITNGVIARTKFEAMHLWIEEGFNFNFEFNKNELKKVSLDIADLFNSAYVMNVYFFGPLSRINEDLFIFKEDLRIPGLLEKIYQRILASSFAFQFALSLINFINEPDFPPDAVFTVIIYVLLVSFIAGIPSTIFIIAELLKKLLIKFRLASLWTNISIYVISAIVVIWFLLSHTEAVAVNVILIFFFTGFAMILTLLVKFLNRYIFKRR